MKATGILPVRSPVAPLQEVRVSCYTASLIGDYRSSDGLAGISASARKFFKGLERRRQRQALNRIARAPEPVFTEAELDLIEEAAELAAAQSLKESLRELELARWAGCCAATAALQGVQRKRKGLSLEEAAAVPVVYKKRRSLVSAY
mgnify:CR=1 FL=1